jgi:TetR/AcrR family transcriptional regulator of autoinduction and epiphytic fitness
MYIVQFRDASMPPINRQDRKRQQTSDRIAEVAFELFETHGYDAVTMEQIATVADVARGTVYNHFAVKEAVLTHWVHAQLQRDLGPLMEAVLGKASFTDRMATLLQASAGWWDQHRGYLAPYIRYRFQGVGQTDKGGRQASACDLVEAYAVLIDLGQKDGELRADVDLSRLAFYLHFLYLSALMRWMADDGLSLADELAGALEFFCDGARPRVS